VLLQDLFTPSALTRKMHQGVGSANCSNTAHCFENHSDGKVFSLLWHMKEDEIRPTGDPGGTIAMPDTETTSIPSETSPQPATRRCPFGEASGSVRTALAPPPAVAKAASTFVALSKFVIANGKTSEVKEAFRHRPHKVDGQPGFVRMEVLSPLNRPDEIWLLTFWTDEASFHTWHHSQLYQDSHKGIPKGLKLVPGETQIRCFEHVAS
jgi:heme-degrading monooxygenase HmoA